MNAKKILTATLILALTLSIIAPLATVQAQSSNTLFKVTIIAPGNANLLRRQWSQVFASNLQQLGIDAKVVYLGWTPVYDRVLTPSPEFVGKTYDENGFDILAIGWTPGLLPEPRQLLYGGDPAFFAPTGQNYVLWNNATSNDLLDSFITSTSDTEKASLLEQWQEIYYEDMPASQIMYQQAPVVINPAIGNLYTPPTGGEGWLYFNAQPYPQLLTRSDSKDSIVYCATGEITALNPPESNSWYDVIVTAPIYGGLAMAWPTLKSVSELETPDLLTSWSHSDDGFTWTFNCRTGVTWHDGEPFSADDVVFSLWALMGGVPDSQFAGYYQGVYGNKCTFTYSNGTAVTLGDGAREGTITATDANTVVAHLPVLSNGKPYGYFEPYLLGFANNIIPKHIFENIAPADWSASPFNTAGTESVKIGTHTYTGPVGTGPYKWVSFDVNSQVVHLERNDAYWNATALKNDGKFGIKDYYIRFIPDKTAALAALKNGEVDMLDYNYQMQTDIPSIGSSWGKVINLDGVGRQEFGYNMRHPIFGTGVDTPLGQSNPARASEAARYIRIAFDYAIPRDLIINNLLSGYGVAGATPMLPTQPFYDNAITARPYDLSQARHYLQLAGYTPPGSNAATELNLQGTVTYANGTAKSQYPIDLKVTTDNSTYTTSLQLVTQITTDLNGAWSFTVSQTAPGTYYYYLFDNSTGTPEYTYLQSFHVVESTPTPTATEEPKTTDLTWIYVAVAVIVIVIVIAAIVLLMRKKSK